MNVDDQDDAIALSLDLSIERGLNGASRLIRHRVAYPWSLGRGYPDDRAGGVMVLPQVAGAGLLAGDTINQRIRVGAGASLQLASAGATLVHGVPGGPAATSCWTYKLEEGAEAVIAAEPNALLDDARLAQQQTIFIHPTATMVLVDSFVDASRNRHVEWSSTTTVRDPNGTILMVDRQTATNPLLSWHRGFSGQWTAFGSLLILMPPEKSSDVLKRIQQSVSSAEKSEWIGIGNLRNNCGIGVRYATQSGASLRAAIHRTLGALNSISQKVSCDAG